MRIQIRDSESFWPGIRDGKISDLGWASLIRNSRWEDVGGCESFLVNIRGTDVIEYNMQQCNSELASYLKIRKNEKFFGSDFDICTFEFFVVSYE